MNVSVLFAGRNLRTCGSPRRPTGDGSEPLRTSFCRAGTGPLAASGNGP